MNMTGLIVVLFNGNGTMTARDHAVLSATTFWPFVREFSPF